MNMEKFNQLIKKYQKGELTGEQKVLFDQWFDALGDSDSSTWTPDQLEALGKKIFERLPTQPLKTKQQRKLPRWLPYAAALLLLPVLGGIYYNLSTSDRSPSSTTPLLANDVAPGGN